jgi:hypothetical protein
MAKFAVYEAGADLVFRSMKKGPNLRLDPFLVGEIPATNVGTPRS